jgi:hypothetical protein
MGGKHMIDESAHKVFDYSMKDWHGFCTHKCSHCSRQLDIYYCESRLYLVRCKHCKIVSLVEARNPNEAAEKVSHCAAPENKPLTLEQLRQMDGEPVWIALLNIAKQPTCEVITKICEDGIHTVGAGGSDYAAFGLYGKTWLAYRRPPEEGEKE